MFRSVRRGSRKFLHVQPPCSGRGTYGLLYLYLCTGGKRGNDQPFSGTASAVSYCAGEKYPGMADGVAAWTKHPAAEIGDTIRLFPHHLHGEGHFVAVLEKEGTVSENYRGYCANGEEKPLAKGEAKAYLAGLQEFLGKIPADDAGRLFLFGEQLYLMPEHMPATRRLHVLRPGLHLGTVKRTGWNRHTHWRLQFLRRKHVTAGICLWMKHARIWPGRRFRQKGRRAGI